MNYSITVPEREAGWESSAVLTVGMTARTWLGPVAAEAGAQTRGQGLREVGCRLPAAGWALQWPRGQDWASAPPGPLGSPGKLS